MSIKQDIENGDVSRGRVLYRKALTKNPQSIEEHTNYAIITSYAVMERMTTKEMGMLSSTNLDASPVRRGRYETGVYGINRGLIGVLNMYKVSTYIAKDGNIPKWYSDHLHSIKLNAEDKYVTVPNPIRGKK